MPPRQAPTFPIDLALGVVTLLVLQGHFYDAWVTLMCFAGLLRVSEALRLCWMRFVRTRDAWIIIIGVAKRGLEQTVLLTDSSIAAWLDGYANAVPPSPKDRVAPTSYARCCDRLTRACAILGFDRVHWTSHGLRRGGATELLRQGVPLENIMVHGRWLSVRSCRDYLRKGEASLYLQKDYFPEGAWNRARTLAAIGHNVWKLLA